MPAATAITETAEDLGIRLVDLIGRSAEHAGALLDMSGADLAGRSVATTGSSLATRRAGSVLAAIPGGTRTHVVVGLGAAGACAYGARTAIQRRRQRRADAAQRVDEHTDRDTPPEA